MTTQPQDDLVTEYDRQISRNVKLAIFDSRKTQKAVAFAAGMNTASMSRSMNALRPWRASEVVLIALATGVDVADLLPHLDSNQEPSD
jgi:hypothetical protein